MNKQLSTMIFTTLLLLVCIGSGLAQTDGLDGRKLDVLFKKKMAVTYYYGIQSLGDQNDDGFDDFMVLNSPDGNRPGKPEIYFGGSPMDTVPVLQWDKLHNSFAVADCNNDGYQDIMVRPGADTLHIYFGGANIDTLVDQEIIIPVSEPPVGLTEYFLFFPQSAADYNGDGYTDFIINDVNYTLQEGYDGRYVHQFGKLYFYTTDEHGVIPEPVTSLTYTSDTLQIFIGVSGGSTGDINNDGYSDLSLRLYRKTLNEYGEYSYNGKRYREFIMGNPEFDFTNSIRFDQDSVGWLIDGTYIIPDLNGDGYDDILTGDPFELYYPFYYNYMLMLGGSTLDTIPDYGVNFGNQGMEWFLPVGDFNGDGYNDFSAQLYSTGKAYIWLGGRPHHYNPFVYFYDFERNEFFANACGPVGDVNGDGCDDFMIGSAGTSSQPKYSNFYIFGGSTDIVGLYEEQLENKVPEDFSVTSAYPNPFNSTTHLNIKLPSAGMLKFTVYDNLGREITSRELFVFPSEHTIEFNAEQYNLASGIYFAQFHFTTNTKEYTETVKMQYLK